MLGSHLSGSLKLLNLAGHFSLALLMLLLATHPDGDLHLRGRLGLAKLQTIGSPLLVLRWNQNRLLVRLGKLIEILLVLSAAQRCSL